MPIVYEELIERNRSLIARAAKVVAETRERQEIFAYTHEQAALLRVKFMELLMDRGVWLHALDGDGHDGVDNQERRGYRVLSIARMLNLLLRRNQSIHADLQTSDVSGEC